MRNARELAPQFDRGVWRGQRDALICALLFGVCVAATYPVSDGGYIDDFSYAKTALEFARTGHMVYNHWATAMLGWMIPWGALFIKLFGFSFLILRICILPIGMVSIYLFHRVLTGFSVVPRNAFVGTLTLGLTPLFLPLTTSFMTDVPGLFVILLCTYMCQRAVSANSDRTVQLWLVFAAIASLAGGTVRQTSWLGALVIVPSTGFLLRRRKGVLVTSIAAAVVSLAGVLLCLRWLDSQPNVYVEPTLERGRVHFSMATLVLKEMIRGVLCLLLLVSPIVVGWLSTIRLRRGTIIRVVVSLSLAGIFLKLDASHLHYDDWLAPWLSSSVGKHGVTPIDQLFGSAVEMPRWLRTVITMLVMAAAVVVTEPIVRSLRQPGGSTESSCGLRTSLWLLGPFSVVYVLLVIPRMAMFALYDRYLLCLLPAAIVFLLLLYQRQRVRTLPRGSLVTLGVVALYTLGGTHDFFADARAGEAAVRELRAAGVPRNVISQSFNTDGWVQLELEERLNMPGAPSPSTVNKPRAEQWVEAAKCAAWYAHYTPAIRPKYYVVESPSFCLTPTSFAPVGYRTWLPPFDRKEYIEERMDSSQ